MVLASFLATVACDRSPRVQRSRSIEVASVPSSGSLPGIELLGTTPEKRRAPRWSVAAESVQFRSEGFHILRDPVVVATDPCVISVHGDHREVERGLLLREVA